MSRLLASAAWTLAAVVALTGCSREADHTLQVRARPALSVHQRDEGSRLRDAHAAFLTKCREGRVTELEVDSQGLAPELHYVWMVGAERATDLDSIRFDVLLGRGSPNRTRPVNRAIVVRFTLKDRLDLTQGSPTLLVEGAPVESGIVLAAPAATTFELSRGCDPSTWLSPAE
ncbi:MAG: hypothetical protein ACRDI1_06810 [Actinomycetota bacterium]